MPGVAPMMGNSLTIISDSAHWGALEIGDITQERGINDREIYFKESALSLRSSGDTFLIVRIREVYL